MKISSQRGNSVKKSVPEFNYLDKTINEKVVNFAEKCAKIGRSSVYTLHNQSRFYSAPVKYGTVTVGFLIGVSDLKHTNCNSDGDMVAMLKRQSITA
jgi:CRISPR/Cas system-associated exonuclease Cas4 (RecB family)